MTRQKWLWEANRQSTSWCRRKCMLQPLLRSTKQLTPARYLQVIGVGISISSIYWWAVRWRKCPKRGEKEKTNKEELGLYEIMILRNAHHFSNPKLKEMQLLTHQLLLVVEEVRDLPSDRDSCLCHIQRKPSFLVAVCTVWMFFLMDS